jgi:SAM-dependent methyltransferase
VRWPWSRRRAAVAKDKRDEAVPYVVIGGRQMAVDSPYMLPKDVSESNRLDFQHYMLRYVLRANFLAPLRDPHDILDVGCGTGRWGAEMAQQFPRANVIGVDIVPPAPNSTAVLQGREEAPENYVFVEGDVIKGLPFGNDAFDFVHMRLVVMALPADKWLPVIQELRRVTRSGGWIELVDTTVTARSPGAARWNAWAQTLAKARGIDLTAGAQVGAFLRQVGLHDEQEIPLEVPLGPWGGRIGQLLMADGLAGARALETPVVQMAHLATKAEFDAALAEMEHDFRTVYGLTQPFYIAFGRK